MYRCWNICKVVWEKWLLFFNDITWIIFFAGSVNLKHFSQQTNGKEYCFKKLFSYFLTPSIMFFSGSVSWRKREKFAKVHSIFFNNMNNVLCWRPQFEEFFTTNKEQELLHIHLISWINMRRIYSLLHE